MYFSLFRNSFVVVWICFSILVLSCVDVASGTENTDTLFSESEFTDFIKTPDVQPLCSASGFIILGDSEATVGSSKEYTLYASGFTGKIMDPAFFLMREEDQLEMKSGEKYARVFSQTGTLKVIARFSVKTGCLMSIEKPITIYEKSILYIHNENEHGIDSDIIEGLKRKGFLLHTISLPKNQILNPSNTLTEFIYKNLSSLKESSVIFLDVEPVNFISALTKVVSQNPEIGVKINKNLIYIISTQNKNLLGKLLAPSMSLLGLSEFFLIDKISLERLLLRLDIRLYNVHQDSSTVRISYDVSPSFYSVGRLVEFLIYHGVSIAFLGVLLSLTVAILAMNFLKQCIGLNVFGIYAPIFLAVSFYFVNPYLIFLLLGAGGIASLFTNAFVKKIYLLYNAKHALLLSLYFILSILFISVMIPEKYGVFEKGIFENVYIIFPFLMVVFAVDKIINEEMKLWSKASLFSVLQFTFVTGVAYSIIRSETVQYFLLSYTDLIFIILILNIIIGRYTGLQFFELFRFLPILKNIQEEE